MAVRSIGNVTILDRKPARRTRHFESSWVENGHPRGQVSWRRDPHIFAGELEAADR